MAKSDIEIAQEATMLPIKEVAEKAEAAAEEATPVAEAEAPAAE